MFYSHELGRFAEQKAAEYLISLNWVILGRNIKNKYGEIDIAAIDRTVEPEELVIVEVRCRTIGKIQSPFDSIGPRKFRTLINSSRSFVENVEWNSFWRIDIIGITINNKINNKNDWELEHIRDATAGLNIFS